MSSSAVVVTPPGEPVTAGRSLPSWMLRVVAGALAVVVVAVVVLLWPARDPAPTAEPVREPEGAVA